MKSELIRGVKTAVVIGFSYIALSTSPKGADAQLSYYRPYYTPPLVRQYGHFGRRIPIGPYLGFGGINYLPSAPSYGFSRNEAEGKRIIHNCLRRNKVPCRIDKPLRFRADGEVVELIVDVQLIDPRRSENPVVIEYRSLEDKQIAQYNEINYQLHREFVNRQIELIKMDWTLPEWQKQRIIADYLYQLGINAEKTTKDGSETPQIGYEIPRPLGLLNKEDILEKYIEIGGKVFVIEQKDTKEELEKELDSIIEDATKDFILREEQAIEIIARRLNQERIPYRTNTIFEINGVKIRPNFLVFPEDGKLPLAVEYLGPNERQINRKIRDYEGYKQKGGIAYIMNQATKAEFLKKLDDIIKALAAK